MVREHDRSQGEELSKYWIVTRILPIDTTQYIRPFQRISVYIDQERAMVYLRNSYSHCRGINALEDILDQVLLALDLQRAFIVWNLIGEYGMQKLPELGFALHSIGYLVATSKIQFDRLEDS